MKKYSYFSLFRLFSSPLSAYFRSISSKNPSKWEWNSLYTSLLRFAPLCFASSGWVCEMGMDGIVSLHRLILRLHRVGCFLLVVLHHHRNHILYLLSLEIKSGRLRLIFRMACALICCTDLLLFAVSFLSVMHENILWCYAIYYMLVVVF